jgi:hypothetical protein
VTGTVSHPVLLARNASLVVRMPGQAESLLDVDGIDLKVRVERSPAGNVLAMDTVKIFDRQEFKSGLSDQLLHLVAPMLSDVADVQGKISLTLEKCRLPLGVSAEQLARGMELSGRLELHEISTSVETPLLNAIVKVLSDLYEKKPSDVVRIVKDADVRFEVREGRLFHKGLTLGFPDISPKLLANSSGSVGLDKSLDLVLEVPSVQAEAGLARENVTREHVRFSIKGTIDDPVVVELEE